MKWMLPLESLIADRNSTFCTKRASEETWVKDAKLKAKKNNKSNVTLGEFLKFNQVRLFSITKKSSPV